MSSACAVVLRYLYVDHARIFYDTNTFLKTKTRTFFETKDMRASVEKIE